jgi:hypothetical protein
MKVARKCKNVAMCLSLLILIITQLPACFAGSYDEASDAIKQADRDLGSAFVAVAEADSAGADVSALLNKLNSADSYLSRAYAVFSIGDYENSSLLATNCSDVVKGVADEAANLRLDVERAHSNVVILSVVASSVGAALVVVFGFVVWRVLVRRYLRKVLDMKPEVRGSL